MSDLLKKLGNNGYDVDKVLERFLNDKNMLIGFIEDFFEDDSYDGLCNAVSIKDYRSAFSCAHTLKGIAANLGFEDLERAASELVEDLRIDKFDKGKFQLVKSEYNKLKNIVI